MMRRDWSGGKVKTTPQIRGESLALMGLLKIKSNTTKTEMGAMKLAAQRISKSKQLQQAMIEPQPGSQSLYYIFSNREDGSAQKIGDSVNSGLR